MASNNKWARLWQHWCHPRWRVERCLPTAALQQLSEAIGRSEQQHSGQIRFVIESRWHSADILQGLDTRRRAVCAVGALSAAISGFRLPESL